MSVKISAHPEDNLICRCGHSCEYILIINFVYNYYLRHSMISAAFRPVVSQWHAIALANEKSIFCVTIILRVYSDTSLQFQRALFCIELKNIVSSRNNNELKITHEAFLTTVNIPGSRGFLQIGKVASINHQIDAYIPRMGIMGRYSSIHLMRSIKVQIS